MKKNLSLLTIVSISLSTFAFATSQNITATDPSKPLYSKDGKAVIIVKAQPSTGYTWWWDYSHTDQGIKLIKRENLGMDAKTAAYFKQAAAAGHVNAGGSSYEEWVFQLPKSMMVAPTQAQISLTYARAWMPSSSVDDKTYLVRTLP